MVVSLFTGRGGLFFRQPDGPGNWPSVSKRVGGGVGRINSEEVEGVES